MDTRAHKDQLLKDGFVRVKGVLNKDELAILANETKKILDGSTIPWSDHSKYKFNSDREITRFSDKINSTVCVGFVGESSEMDSLLEKVVTHPTIQGILTETMGPGYKLCEIGIRRAEPKGPGMGLHQDSTGEISLSILLTDTPTIAGTTVFVPKSHLCPLPVHQTVLDRIPVKWLRKFLGGATGSAGDLCFFFGRTFHGRFPHDSNGNIMISLDFFAVGAHYFMKKTKKDVLAKLGPELRRLLDTDTGLKILDAKRGQVEVLPVPDYASFIPHPIFKIILNGREPLSKLSPWRMIQILSMLVSIRKTKSWLTYYWNYFFNKEALRNN